MIEPNRVDSQIKYGIFNRINISSIADIISRTFLRVDGSFHLFLLSSKISLSSIGGASGDDISHGVGISEITSFKEYPESKDKEVPIKIREMTDKQKNVKN